MIAQNIKFLFRDATLRINHIKLHPEKKQHLLFLVMEKQSKSK